MTLDEFKKAVKKSVKQLSYASILKEMRIDEYLTAGEKLSSKNVALVSVYNDRFETNEYRVYYNFRSMGKEIGYTFHDDYSDACDEFMKSAR